MPDEGSPGTTKSAEQGRLDEARENGVPWKQWGPYLSERQWGTVREDYSENGDAWNYFTHDQARSRAYHWGEDGLAGISDEHQRLCFALALWNGKDPILKERLFGLTNSEGNHGEDVKEYYYYLDSTPTHSYMKYLYKYPQSGERVRGRANIRAPRVVQPSSKRFKVRRIISAADLWVTELLITYDARPSYSVSIMELKDGKVARETQYFCDPFEPGPSRARWVERIGWTRTGPPASFGASLLRPYNCRCLRRSSGWRVATRDEVSDEP